jgi:hypothetical protein
MVERSRAKMTKWRELIACWIPYAPETNSEYIKVIATIRKILRAYLV